MITSDHLKAQLFYHMLPKFESYCLEGKALWDLEISLEFLGFLPMQSSPTSSWKNQFSKAVIVCSGMHCTALDLTIVKISFTVRQKIVNKNYSLNLLRKPLIEVLKSLLGKAFTNLGHIYFRKLKYICIIITGCR